MDFLSDEEKNILRDLIKTEIETLNYYDRLSDLDISENAYNLEYMYLVNKIRTNHELVKELYNIFINKGINAEIRDYWKEMTNCLLGNDSDEFCDIIVEKFSNYIDMSFLEYKDEDTKLISGENWYVMLNNIIAEVMACDIKLIYIEELLKLGRNGNNNFIKKAYLEIYKYPLVEENLLFRNFDFSNFRDFNFCDCIEKLHADEEDCLLAASSIVSDLNDKLYMTFYNKENYNGLEEELFCKMIGYYKVFDIDTSDEFESFVNQLRIVQHDYNIRRFLEVSFKRYHQSKGRYR